MHLAHHSLKKRVNECIAYTFGKNIFNPNEKEFEFLFTIKMSKYEIYFRVDFFSLGSINFHIVKKITAMQLEYK